MFGGLHIEMAALRTLGDWLQGNGWVQALVQAEIATAGTADSFLRASHVLRTSRSHQVTAAALYILQHRAYKHYCLGETRDAEDLPEFEDWCCQRGEDIPQFHYWATVLELELLVQAYVRSLRQGSLMMYLDALTELVHWFHALDHTHYARWIPVHLKDMAELTTKHPDVSRKFREGHFTFRKHRGCSLQSLLTRHMSRILAASKETVEQLGSLTTLVPYVAGWLRDQKLPG
ncbi:hypothetical protein ACOMHN_014973 [Nucella lapillus]